MKGNQKTGQLFNFVPNSYFERTSRPIYAIIFLLPFIVFYEFGTLLINTDVLNQSQVRVVAFVWLQDFLEYLGFGSRFAWMSPPLAVVIILLALQVTSRKRWYFIIGDFGPMIIECVLLAVPLIVLSLFINGAGGWRGDTAGKSHHDETVISCRSSFDSQSEGFSVFGKDDEPQAGGFLLADIITGIGAGIYEELVFRLILICLLLVLFQDVFRLGQRTSIILAVVISAALFSAHHHIVLVEKRLLFGTHFNWPEFLFRTLAGVYFSIVFAIRGFGITAGAHAFYDTIAVLINSFFFAG